ncbi:MAG: branched-chain amino acid ABC transporter permease [Sciscionella sp.]
MNPIVAYIVTLVFYFFDFSILGWGLNIQFGLAGILDFTLITFFAVGAYLTAVFSLGPPSAGEQYIFGFGLPFPLGLIAGAIVAGLLGMVIGLLAFKRLRSDYLAIVMIAVGTIIYDLVSNYVPLFNGVNGTTGVPQPFVEMLNLGQGGFLYVITAIAGIITIIAGFFVHRLFDSPLGRVMRAIRDDPDAVRSVGKSPFRYQMLAMVIGCVYSGIAGGLLVEFISAIDPSGWTTGETFIMFAALIIGGVGNNRGVMVGALLVPVAFQEATRFLPAIGGNPDLIPALRNIVVGALLIGFLWFRPQGIIPERLKRFAVPSVPPTQNTRVAVLSGTARATEVVAGEDDQASPAATSEGVPGVESV